MACHACGMPGTGIMFEAFTNNTPSQSQPAIITPLKDNQGCVYSAQGDLVCSKGTIGSLTNPPVSQNIKK